MKKPAVFIALVLLCLLARRPVRADTGYYLVSLYPDEGQKSVDYKYWNAKPSGGAPASEPELGLGYNVNGRWFTEVGASWFHTDARGTRLSAYEWQNDFMLTQGQLPFDLALHTNVQRNHVSTQGYGLEFGPVLQTEAGRTQFNLNLFFSRDYRAVQLDPMQLAYQWQVKYRWRTRLEFGMQGFGELGPWDHWAPHAAQSHRVGPALFGRWDLAGKQAIQYEAAYLIGSNATRNAKSVTMRLQYLF